MTTTAIEKKQEGKAIVRKTLHDLIRDLEPQIKMALPRHMDAGKLVRIALTEIRRTPKLQKCTPESFLGALMMSAQLGLEPGVLGEAYIIPYENRKAGAMEAQFQIGYQGMLKLVRNSDQVSKVSTHVVYENDQFSYKCGLDEDITHTPTEGERGKPKYVYACAHYKDGSKQFVVLNMADIQKVKNVSKAKDDGPWVTWPERMMEKTALKLLAKRLPMSTENRRLVMQDETTKHFTMDTVNILEAPDETDWEETPAAPFIAPKALETVTAEGEVLTLTAEPLQAENTETK